MKLSIVIPCYNEEKNISLILSRFKGALMRDDIEVIIVDNGSTDGSADILRESLPGYSFARSVRVPVNQGYGFGILAGLNEARGEYIGWTHGDLQTPPADVVKALEIIEKLGNPKDIYVKGRRKGRPLFDGLFTLGMSIFESLYMHALLYDINAQPNIFHRSFFKRWNDPPHDFSLDLYALYLAKKSGLRITRFPVVFAKRIHGESHWNKNFRAKWKFIRRTLEFSFLLKKRLKKSSV